MGLRECRDCGRVANTVTELSLFKEDKSMKYNKSNLCKSCDSRRGSKYQQTETGKANLRNNEYLRKYGIILAKYEEMHSNQDGVCKICKQEDNQRLAIDHCHDSLEVRGLLCRKCNLLLGLAKDNTSVLNNAVKYLKAYYEHREL